MYESWKTGYKVLRYLGVRLHPSVEKQIIQKSGNIRQYSEHVNNDIPPKLFLSHVIVAQLHLEYQ